MSLVEVFRLVRSGDVEGLRTLISSSTDPSIILNQLQTNSNLTPLMQACNHGNIDIVELFLENRAMVDFQGYYALTNAVKNGNLEIVKLIIKHGGQTDLKTDSGMSAFLTSCEKGNVEIVKALLEGTKSLNDALPDYICEASSDYITGMDYPVSRSPFNTAVKHKNTDLVKWFLESGKFTDIPVGALFLAIKNPSSNMAKLLFDHGAQLQAQRQDGDPFTLNPLMMACLHGCDDLVKLILTKGAEVNLKNENGESVLILAAKNGETKVVKELLEGGADVNLKGNRGSTALLSVLLARLKVPEQITVDIVKLLLKYGADVKMQNDEKCTPLSIAIAMQSAEIVKLLLNENSDLINQLHHLGIYPLEQSSEWPLTSCPIVQLLLDAGADINQKNHNGLNALMHKTALNMAKFLIEKGIDVNMQDDSGQYALLRAFKMWSFELIELLLENGADHTLRTDDGDSVISEIQKDGVKMRKQLEAKMARVQPQPEIPLYPKLMSLLEPGKKVVSQPQDLDVPQIPIPVSADVTNPGRSLLVSADGGDSASTIQDSASPDHLPPPISIAIATATTLDLMIKKEVTVAKLNTMKWRAPSGEEKVLKLKEAMSEEWYELGQNVGVTDAKLAGFRVLHHSSLKDCMNSVILEWIKKGIHQKYPPNWEGLIKLLRDVEYNNLAEKILEAAEDPESTLYEIEN